MSQPAKKLNSFDAPSKKVELEYNWRVLIVEDEPAIAEAIKAIIAPSNESVIPIHRSSRSRSAAPDVAAAPDARKDKFEVVLAKNPTEALQQVKWAIEDGKPFAMGFFDVLLGSEIDGIELVRQIQIMDPKIYAVFVTAYHDRTVDAIGQILGSGKSDRWDYMNKPFTDGSILQKARNSVALWNLREEKRLQEEQLAEAANLLLQGERSNAVAAVGRSVAHEFGNLLMHIMGHAELALMKDDQEQMKKALNTILKAGDTATSVLNKFKNNVSAQAEAKVINLDSCLDEALDLMSHEFKKKNISVQRTKFSPCELVANPHSLVQVFINLFINATHAMPGSGQIDITLGMAAPDPDGDPEDSWYELNIRDHGSGIPEEIMPMVMQPLFTTKGKNGSGLGLAICKEIIENEHQGQFLIANHSEKGLVVTIRLPVKAEVSDE